MQRKINVLVVDDSIVARSVIVAGITSNSNINVIGTCACANDAKQALKKLKPDVITLDIEMPDQNGIDLLKELLPLYKIPVILVSNLDIRIFDALVAGAVDFVKKPSNPDEKKLFISTLSQKIIAASKSSLKIHSAPPLLSKTSASSVWQNDFGRSEKLDNMIIAIGASTGGVEATAEILEKLPVDTPGIIVVQHLPTGFTKMYAERLDKICSMRVREAKNGDKITRGLVLIAPADFQTSIYFSDGNYYVSCKAGEKVSGHRPSVDVLFQSMADKVKCAKVGIILTGMGQDGAQGLLSMRKAGAYTIGQDESSSVVYGMPRVAFNIGAVETQVSYLDVPKTLINHINKLK